MVYEFFRKFVWLGMHIKHRIKVIGGDNRPYKNGIKGGYIIACNHQEYSDPPLIAAVNRAKFSFMAKSELFESNKLFAWLIRRCGAFPVVRGAGDNSAIDHAISDLESGRAFVIFPEGTRSKDGNISRAKSGIAVIAGKANAPVLPVCIKYGKKGFRRRAWISIGKMIPAEQVAIQTDDRNELRRVSNLIMDNIKMLMDGMSEYGDPLPRQYVPKDENPDKASDSAENN